MGLLYASWTDDLVREHGPLLALLVCVLLALLVVRLVGKALTRAVLLGLLALVALFVYVERDELRECAQRCRCHVAGLDVEVPACEPRPLAVR